MRNIDREEGFSLIELTIAALLTVGLVGAIFSLLNRNQQVFVNEAGVTDLNQNMRTLVDLLTRDVQSAGMGLPSRVSGTFSGSGTFAAIYAVNGTGSNKDKLLIINGDPYAPTASVSSQSTSPAKFICAVPTDATITGSGSSTVVTYKNAAGTSVPFYKNFATVARSYIVYDDKLCRVFTLTGDGQVTGSGSSTQLELSYNSTNYATTAASPATTIGSTIDTGTPTYNKSKIALLSSLVAYRLSTTNELERTEDLVNWYTVARGVLDFQVTYRVVTGKDANGKDIEDKVDAPTTSTHTSIRAVLFKLIMQTPDLQPKDKGYRIAGQSFEVSPRNFNLVNNTNISAPIN
ncbi:MAG TPA: hypothetical protein VJX74_20200 [Blastocatellia bacterium]|nr:hypothetical protein [Blastocatellia bacterium]